MVDTGETRSLATLSTVNFVFADAVHGRRRREEAAEGLVVVHHWHGLKTVSKWAPSTSVYGWATRLVTRSLCDGQWGSRWSAEVSSVETADRTTRRFYVRCVVGSCAQDGIEKMTMWQPKLRPGLSSGCSTEQALDSYSWWLHTGNEHRTAVNICSAVHCTRPSAVDCGNDGDGGGETSSAGMWGADVRYETRAA